MASWTEAHGLSTLPWPEILLLSTAKQHGVQGGKFTDPSYIQSTDPGAVELEGKTSRLLTQSCWQPAPFVSECERHKVLPEALGSVLLLLRCGLGCLFAMTLVWEVHRALRSRLQPSLRTGRR